MFISYVSFACTSLITSLWDIRLHLLPPHVCSYDSRKIPSLQKFWFWLEFCS